MRGPITAVLAARGLIVYGLDAFQARFPAAAAECSTVETSDFFGPQFYAIEAWGLLFLLPASTQRELIGKMGKALESGGRLLFTAPCRWALGWMRRRAESPFAWGGTSTGEPWKRLSLNLTGSGSTKEGTSTTWRPADRSRHPRSDAKTGQSGSTVDNAARQTMARAFPSAVP